MSDEEHLEKLARQIVVCTKCELHRSRKNAVPGEGPTHAEIMFIGEGPGAREDEQGRPFVGASGKFLDQLLERAGVTRGSGKARGDAIALGDEVVDGELRVADAAPRASHALAQAFAARRHRPEGVGHEVLGDQLVDRRVFLVDEDPVDDGADAFLVPLELRRRAQVFHFGAFDGGHVSVVAPLRVRQRHPSHAMHVICIPDSRR